MMSFKMLQRFTKRRANGSEQAAFSPLDEGLAFTIRFAYPDDQAALRRLAALDSQSPPSGRLLVAEVDGELWAAVNIGGQAGVIADPFRHTAALVGVLRDRADGLSRQGSRPARRRSLSVAL